MRLTLHMFLSLDGVLQGPGGPEEDTSGGFTRGGWVVPFTADPGFGEIVDGWFRKTGALLYGRVGCQSMAGYWPQVTDPDDHVAARLNAAQKYLVSSTLTDPAWGPVEVLTGDVLERVRALKARDGGELQVHGSGRLARTLSEAGLVDEYRLVTFPVVLGQGRRLFDEGAPPTGFTVTTSRTTANGLTYVELTPEPIDTGRTFGVVDGAQVVRA